MDLITIKDDHITRTNLITTANIADEPQIDLLKAASLKIFQEEIASLLKLDYPQITVSTSADSILIKQFSDINVAQKNAIKEAYNTSLGVVSYALLTPAILAADKVLATFLVMLFLHHPFSPSFNELESLEIDPISQ